MKTSTSFHRLNADGWPSKPTRILWLILNLINNSYYPNRATSLNIRKFCPDLDESEWKQIHTKSSPSRALSDLFWLKLDWSAIKSELGNINIHDTGCGSGGIALRLSDFSQCISTYYGVDAVPHKTWDALQQGHGFVTFAQLSSDEIFDSIPRDTNLFITQSAVEHFENDLIYFRQIRDFIDETGNDAIQIHLFPSAANLKLYLFHGVRQYTPRTISKITEVFDMQNFYSLLFRLGGTNCNRLHYGFITIPLLIKRQEDWRNTRTDEYRKLLKAAVEADIALNDDQPCFYALVMHSNFNEKIFENMHSLSGHCI